MNSQKAWHNLMQPIQRAFDTSITGIIMGTTTLQKAVANITQSIIAEFVNLGVKMVTNWIAVELAMTTATEAGAAARTAAEGEGLAAGLALKALNAVKSIVTDSGAGVRRHFRISRPDHGAGGGWACGGRGGTVMAAAERHRISRRGLGGPVGSARDGAPERNDLAGRLIARATRHDLRWRSGRRRSNGDQRLGNR